MGEIKLKVKALRRSFLHANRRAEMLLMERFLYRNRSQHHGARYFRRLQCAIRARKRLDALPLWPYILDGDAERIAGHVLDDLVREYEQYREYFIGTAEKAKTDLIAMIAQGFFMPFCVATWSCLARIFTIEARIRSDVLALAATCRSLTPRAHKNFNDDIGGETVKPNQAEVVPIAH